MNFWSRDHSSKKAAKSAQNPSGAGLTQNADQADSEEGVTRSESSMFRALTLSRAFAPQPIFYFSFLYNYCLLHFLCSLLFPLVHVSPLLQVPPLRQVGSHLPRRPLRPLEKCPSDQLKECQSDHLECPLSSLEGVSRRSLKKRSLVTLKSKCCFRVEHCQASHHFRHCQVPDALPI